MRSSPFRRRITAVTIAGLAVAGIVVPAAPAAAADLGDAWTDKARYAPGEQVTVTAEVSGTGPVLFSLVHLGTVVDTGTVTATGSGQVNWTVAPPSDDFTGYMVHVDAGTSTAQTAVDVSGNWTRFPRTGFLDTYPTDLDATEQAA
jgi:dextranase